MKFALWPSIWSVYQHLCILEYSLSYSLRVSAHSPVFPTGQQSPTFLATSFMEIIFPQTGEWWMVLR